MTAIARAIADDLGVPEHELVVAAIAALIATPLLLGLVIGMVIGLAAAS